MHTELPYEAGLGKVQRELTPVFATPSWRDAHLRHLKRKIARNPRDLFSHVQRAHLCHQAGDTAGTWGAILDLYLVLGQSGQALRRSMIRRLGHVLERWQRQFLRDALERGLHANQSLPEAGQSLLAAGLEGQRAVVVWHTGSNHTGTVAQAGLLIAGGNTDLAQTLLEAQLEQDPGDAEVTARLLQLYRDEHKARDFRHCFIRLAGRKLALREQWQLLNAYFYPTESDCDA